MNVSFNKLLIFLILGFLLLVVSKETALTLPSSSAVLSAVSFSTFALLLVKTRRLTVPIPASIILFLFIAWMLVSANSTVDLTSTFWEVLRTLSYLVLFLTVYNLTKEQSAKKLLILGFVAIGAAILIQDLYYFLISGKLSTEAQFSGSLAWHNQMAALLLLLIPISANLLFLSTNRYIRLSLLFVIVASIIGIILTRSRGGWVSLIAVSLLLPLFLKKTKKNWKIVAVAIVIILGFTFLISNPTQTINRLQSIISEISPQSRSVSGNLRLSVIRNSFEITLSAPIFGIGPGAFGSVYHKFQDEPWLYARYAHNQLLNYAAEIGVPGALIFISLLLLAIKLGVRNRKKLLDQKDHPLIAGVVVALFAITLHSLIDVDFSRVALFSLFWIFLAIFFVNFEKKEKTFEIFGVRKLFYLVPVSFIFFSLLLILAENNFHQDDDSYALEQAILLNPFESRYYFRLGELQKKQGRINEAKEKFQNAAKLSQYESEPYHQLGLIEFDKGNFEMARIYFEKTIEVNPYSHPMFYDSLADTYMKLNKSSQAQGILESAVFETFPLNETFRGFEYIYNFTGLKKDLANTYMRLATLYISQNQKEKAVLLLDVVEKELNPMHPLLPVLINQL